MTYRVELISSEEGYAVSCPELPGCHSQGTTEEEALENIRSAIHHYVEVQQEIEAKKVVRYVEVDALFRNTSPSPFEVKPVSFELPKQWTDNKTSTLLEILEGPDWR